MSEARALQPVPGFTSTARAFEDEFDYLYRALRRYGVSAADAEDLVQDVFVVMWRRWADYQTDRPLRPWLAGIAVNLAQKHLRRSRREVPDGDIERDLEDHGPRPEDRVGAAHARALVLRALGRLPEKYRLAIVLHEIDELSMHELAALLAIPLATAYTRVRRARLLFATAVREAEQAAAPDGRTQAAALVPAGLFELERLGAPAPAQLRRRAIARARALEHVPRAELPDPASASPRSLLRAWPALGTAGILALLAAVLLPSVGRHARRTLAEPATRGREAERGKIEGVGPIALAAARPVLARSVLLPTGALEPSAGLGRGLVGYWRFDDARGSAVARDLSSSAHDCVLHGLDPDTAWVKGAFGGAIRLGARTWLECPQPVSHGPALELTITAWTKRTTMRDYHGAIASRQLGSDKKSFFMLSLVGPDLEFRSDVAHGTARQAVPDPHERWVHVAVSVRRDGVSRLFVDGVAIAEKLLQQRASLVDSPLIVGAARDLGGQMLKNFHGDLDELALYDRALGDDEIAALAHGAQPLAPRSGP